MSTPRNQIIICPGCGKKYETVVYGSVNTDLRGSIADEIISGDFFYTTCPHCSNKYQIRYDFLYNDLKHNKFVWLLYKDSGHYENSYSDVIKTDSKGVETVIVNSIDEMRTAVSCLEANRDDRIIALYKCYLLDQISKQEIPFTDIWPVFLYIDGKELFYFRDSEGKTIHTQLDDKVYDSIEKKFMPIIEYKNYGDWGIYNEEWAKSFLKSIERTESSNAGEVCKCNEEKKLMDDTMPAVVRELIKCPECGKTYPVERYQRVDTQNEEADTIKEKIVSGELFKCVCPTCGWTIDTEYPMLYHDPKKKLMIWNIPYEAENGKELMKELFEAEYPEDYERRIVGSFEELSEKVKIFERGFDDKVVEICKRILECNYRDAHPELGFDIAKKMLYYNKSNEDTNQIQDKLLFVFEKNGKPINVRIDLEQGYYNNVKETMKPFMDKYPKENLEQIDILYADDIVGQYYNFQQKNNE